MTHLKTMGVMVLVIVVFYIRYTYPVFTIKALIGLFIITVYWAVYRLFKDSEK